MTVTDVSLGIDRSALGHFLEVEMPGTVQGELHAELLAGGHSNLTFAVTDGQSRWVLRRPPLGEHSGAAHDMGREYRVMSALSKSPIPVPVTVVYCDDTAVLGAPFYLMEFVDGVVYNTVAQTATLGAPLVRQISFALTDVLADLHTLDPGSVGLTGLGRPSGYLERQVTRWTGQVDEDLARTAGVRELVTAFREQTPSSPATVLIHGDFRLDNAIINANGDIAAVVDWEMATLGDPLVDLGLFWCYWTGLPGNPGETMTKGISPEMGFPSIAELIERYTLRTGYVTEDLAWYAAFGYFKLAVIRAGIQARYRRGEIFGEGFDRIGDLIEPLIQQATNTLQGRS